VADRTYVCCGYQLRLALCCCCLELCLLCQLLCCLQLLLCRLELLLQVIQPLPVLTSQLSHRLGLQGLILLHIKIE
jgi:hypothetical protein